MTEHLNDGSYRLTLPLSLSARLEMEAVASGIGPDGIIAEALRQYFNKPPKARSGRRTRDLHS